MTPLDTIKLVEAVRATRFAMLWHEIRVETAKEHSPKSVAPPAPAKIGARAAEHPRQPNDVDDAATLRH